MIWDVVAEIGVEYLEEEFAGMSLEEAKQSAEQIANKTEYPQFDERQERLEYRRAMRVKNCGKPSPKINVEEKGFKWYPFYCNNYRECLKCRDRRAREIRNDMERAVNSGELFYAVVNDEISKEFVSEMNKDEYRRFPLESGEVALFSSAEFVGSQRLDELSVTSLPWEEIAVTPNGSRMSGSLGKYQASSQDDTVSVKTYHVLTNAPTSIEIEASKIARQAVEDLNEQTQEDIQTTVEILKNTFEKAIHSMGYQVLVKNISTQHVNLARIKDLNRIKQKAKINLN